MLFTAATLVSSASESIFIVEVATNQNNRMIVLVSPPEVPGPPAASIRHLLGPIPMHAGRTLSVCTDPQRQSPCTSRTRCHREAGRNANPSSKTLLPMRCLPRYRATTQARAHHRCRDAACRRHPMRRERAVGLAARAAHERLIGILGLLIDSKGGPDRSAGFRGSAGRARSPATATQRNDARNRERPPPFPQTDTKARHGGSRAAPCSVVRY